MVPIEVCNYEYTIDNIEESKFLFLSCPKVLYYSFEAKKSSLKTN